MAELYMPSNADDGIAFAENFCVRCIYYGDPDNGDGCHIETNALAGIQPVQWIEDDNGPRCTAFWPSDQNRPSVALVTENGE